MDDRILKFSVPEAIRIYSHTNSPLIRVVKVKFEMMDSKLPRTVTITVILHNIRSMHNVGSIFRTADAAGVKKIYLCGITPSPKDEFGLWRSQISKVSLGAEKYIEWGKINSTTRLIERLKKENYFVIAIEQSKQAMPYCRFKYPDKKIALVLGNEVRGLSPQILSLADQIVEIPMYGKKESLNVSVAFGIVVYHLRYGV